ncbi:YphA family membrane protein [Priestia megaterium]|uniref:YphA family membrane protein n=1 Tax=Priestia megaterium TaxID=1404 RepID=UPI00094C79F5|nr:hypothetical protein [Priestia megaterium]MBU8686286.1 hypothetical protein [Priestia megaterium]MED4138422.1 hypothetical protein [Priestia megaterium]OLO41556.1 hypothetical protein BTA37_03060 [Priestia megaterium]
MDGIFFYWLSWMGWIVATFLMPKTPRRWKVAAIILISILLSGMNMHMAQFSCSYTALFLVGVACVYASGYSKFQQLYYVIVCGIIIIAYAGFCLLELYDPVWIFIDRKWILTGLILYICFMVIKDAEKRFAAIILGVVGGDFLYAVVIRDIASYEVGSLRTLDVLATAVGAMFIWEMLVYFSAYLDLYVLKSHRQKQSTYK